MGAKSTVTLVVNSNNSKLGGIATTHAAIHTCPDSCPLKHTKACYRNTGMQRYTSTALDAHQARLHESHVDTARKEAALIDNLNVKTDLRVHTVGDCKSAKAARLVSKACERFMERTGGVAYTYTHAWRDVPRKAWGKVSILASCEKLGDVKVAMKRGYAAAVIVPKHTGWKAYEQDGVRLLPCPKQTGKVESCKACRICMRAEMLLKGGLVVAFEAHGPSRKVRNVLEKENCCG